MGNSNSSQPKTRLARSISLKRRIQKRTLLFGKSFKKAKKTTEFLCNFNKMRFNLTTRVTDKMLLFHLIKVKPLRGLILEGIDLRKMSLLELASLFLFQKNLRMVHLSFEKRKGAASTFKVKYNLDRIFDALFYCPYLRKLSLANWGKKDTIEISGKSIGRIVNSSPIATLYIEKFEILKITPDLTMSLVRNYHLKKFSMQSTDKWKKEEVYGIYCGFKNHPSIEKIEMLDKYSAHQIAWRQLANLIIDSRCLREIKIKGNELTSTTAQEEMENALRENTSLRSVSFQHFSDHVPLSYSVRYLDALQFHLFLEFIDLSHNVITTENLIEALAIVVNSCPGLKGLYLREVADHNHPSLVPLLEAITLTVSIQQLDLSCNILFHEDIAAIQELLINNTVLEELNLSACNMGDLNFIDIFSAMSENNSLKTLLLKEQSFINPNFKQSPKSIKSFLKNNETLHELSLKGNNFKDKGSVEILKGLSRNKSLKKINLTNTGMGIKGLGELQNLLKSNKVLENISFGEQTQTVDEVEMKEKDETKDNGHVVPRKPAFRASSKNSILVLDNINSISLDLKDLELKNALDQLSSHSRLRKLEIDLPFFTANSLQALGTSLPNIRRMKVCKLIGEFEKGAVAKFAQGLEKGSLKYLTLIHTQISNKEIETIFQPLIQNTKLQYLHLYFGLMELNDSYVFAIHEILQQNRTLKFLGLNRGNLSKKGIKQMLKIKKKNFWLTIEIF